MELRLNKQVNDHHSFQMQKNFQSPFLRISQWGKAQQYASSLKWNVSFVSHPVGINFDFKILSEKTLQTLRSLTAIISGSVKHRGNVFISALYSLQRFHLEGIPQTWWCFLSLIAAQGTDNQCLFSTDPPGKSKCDLRDQSSKEVQAELIVSVVKLPTTFKHR